MTVAGRQRGLKIDIWKKNLEKRQECVRSINTYFFQILFKRATYGRWVNDVVDLEFYAGQCFISLYKKFQNHWQLQSMYWSGSHHTSLVRVSGCIAISIVWQCISNIQTVLKDGLIPTTLSLQMVFVSICIGAVIIQQLCCSSPIFEWSCCCHSLLWRLCGEDLSGPNIYLQK